VTLDSGLLHLAGTTDTFIIQLGSAKDPRFSSPYRKGTRNYKYIYVKGKCDLFCTNNMKYSIKEWGTMNSIPPLTDCLENKPKFECHSSIEDVTNTITYLINNNIV
jgi:ADP-heptose:LPS heptosyltransferase